MRSFFERICFALTTLLLIQLETTPGAYATNERSTPHKRSASPDDLKSYTTVLSSYKTYIGQPFNIETCKSFWEFYIIVMRKDDLQTFQEFLLKQRNETAASEAAALLYCHTLLLQNRLEELASVLSKQGVIYAAEASRLKALLSIARVDRENAATLLKRYLAKRKTPEAFAELSLALSGLSQNDLAKMAINKAQEIFPELPELYLAKAELLEHTNNINDALKLLDSYIEKIPRDFHARQLRVRLLLAQGKEEKAKLELSNFCKISPDSFECFRVIAYLYQTIHKPRKAIDYWSRCIKMNPKDCRAWLGRAEVLSNILMFDLATQDCKQALKIDPKSERGKDLLQNCIERKQDLQDPHS